MKAFGILVNIAVYRCLLRLTVSRTFGYDLPIHRVLAERAVNVSSLHRF